MRWGRLGGSVGSGYPQYHYRLVLKCPCVKQFYVQWIYAMKIIKVLTVNIYYHEYMNIWIFHSTLYIYLTAFTI